MPIAEFNDIYRAYERGTNVLDGVSFSIEPGQVVGLVGKNGAGKTTLLRIAMGMIEVQQGSVQLFGLDPREQSIEVKQRVGYVSEDQILPPVMRVDAIINLHRGLFPTWDEEVAQQLIERFEIPRRAKIKNLSKGQARQVALVCAIAHRPELLLLDEPAGGLDPAARREFLETSIRLLNETGSTILFSSHYMTDVERLADRIVMIHDGRVLIDTELDELRENYSLALVPHEAACSRADLLALSECLGVRDRSDALHAIFELEPERTNKLLEHKLGVRDARCTRIALEEMFIELAGGQG
ncbi:MAG: ABC transporter ATP-binding protein [Thermoanaerobaculia bacterium]